MLEIDVYQASISVDLNVKSIHGMNQIQGTATQALAGPSHVSCTNPGLMSHKTELMGATSFIQVSHDSTFEQIDVQKVDNAMSVIPGAEYSFEKTLSFRQNEPENGVVVSVESTPEIEASSYRSCLPESTSETICELHSSVHDRSSSPECVTDKTILLTESGASSPESVPSVNELNFLAPNSPIPQFRPLSPLPPLVFPWETGDVGASAQGQPLLSAPGGTSMLLTPEAEERPLTPMVSNKRPFGTPVSLGSEYSGERYTSPQSNTFDIDDRASSPESVILETVQWFLTSSEHVTLSPDFDEMRPLSPESITAHYRIPPDSPIPEFRQVSESFTTCQCRSSSPKSVSSDMEFETTLLLSTLFEDRPTSPESVVSVNEYKALSPDSPIPEFSHNWPGSAIVMIGERSTSPESGCTDVEYGSGVESESVLPVVGHRSPSPESIESAEIACDSIPADHRTKLPELSVSDTENKLPTSVESVSEYDDDWVVIFLSDTEERPLSPEPVPDDTPMSPQSAMIDIRASSPESETFNECLSPDSSIPQYMPSLHHAVTINDHSSSPEFELSDTKHEAMPSLSYFENRPLSPDFSGSVSDCGPLPNPVTDLTLEDDMTLEPTGATIFVEAYAEKQFETKTNIVVDLEKSKISTCISSKSEEENLMKHNETEAPKTKSVVLDGSQSNKNIVTAPAEPEVLSTGHHIPFSLTEYSVPVYSLAYDAELWKLISQIRDPQYVGETFMSKTGVCQFAGTSTEFYRTKSDVTVEDEAAVSSTRAARSLSPDCEAEYSPKSPQSLLVPDAFKPDSSHSGRSVDSQRALTPDSPIPHYFASFSGLSQVYHRLVSTESVLSDLDLETDLNISFLFEDRPASPDSVASVNICRELSPDSPIPEFRPPLPESAVITRLDRSSSLKSISSDLECVSVSLSLLFTANRPSSPDSIDEDRPLSSESPIPVFGQALPESAVWSTVERSSSPVSVCSDLEYGAMSLSQLSSEVRPSSPDSVVSGDDYRGDSPIPEFDTGLTESVSVIAHRTSSPESVVSDVEYTQSSVDISICEQRPDSPESQVSETTERPVGGSSQTSPLKAIQVPVYRLVYDAELWKLISQIRDPHYVGETFCSKTGVFEYAGTRIEYILVDSDVKEGELEDGVKLDIADSSGTDFLQAMQTKIEEEERPVLPDSEYRPISPGELILVSAFRSDSPESLKDLSRDSLVPHLSFEFANIAQLPYSPKSAVPNEESDLCMPWLFNENRPSSPSSVISADENRALSPHLLLPDFRLAVPESVTATVGYRSSSPESVLPDSASEAFTDQRADSPKSVVSMLEERQLAAGATFRAKQLICQVYDPHYVGKAFVSRADVFEYVENSKQYVPLDSDAEETRRLMSPNSEAEYRPLSPEALRLLSVLKSDTQETGNSVDEYRPLCPDSPILLPEAPVEHHRAPSSESVSDTDQIEQFDVAASSTESRLSSPESEGSLSKHRPLSPDLPVPDCRLELQNSLALVGGYRSSSPESGASDLVDCGIQERPDSPDSVTSEINMRRLLPESVTEYRPMSPQSLIITTELRTSPVSTRTVNECRTLSADSPLPQFRQYIPDSPISEFRQALLHQTISTAKYRSTSPESVCYSDIEYKDESFVSVSDDRRPPSPDSVASGDERQAVSPDSPVPQFIARVVKCFPSFVGFRSTSPESATSDGEYAPLIDSPPDTEERPDSPESLELEVEERPLSPDSESEYKPFSPTSLMLMSNFRSSSPESSVSLNKFRALSPDSPIPEFRQVLQESLNTYMEYRSSSPESVLSDLEVEMELPFSMLLEDRPSSPESLASVSKYRRLSPDSPILEFRPALPVPCADVYTYRSLSPESVASDAPLMSQLFEVEGRTDSPQSILSFYECQCLSPDSPVPQYTYTEPPMVTIMYRSKSPGSVYSDEDLETDLCIPWLFEDRAASRGSAASKDEFRPLSPDSPILEFTQALQESSVSHMDLRSSSPESVLSDLDMEIELSFPMIRDDRPSSPESLESKYRGLSPDSPVPDFRQAFLDTYPEFNAYRSLSPESEASEIEYAPLISQMSEFEDRTESCQSGASDSDLRCLSPDSPLPQYTMSAPTMLGVRYRSTSPESVYSDDDLETDLCIPWLFEDRAASPGSTASNDEFRPLSPDSPIPEFREALHESTISLMDLRSTSPESVLSDLEMELPFPTFLESRPSSLDSRASIRLSPDSPVPDFMQPMFEIPETIFGHRSASPESTCSNIEYIVISLGSPVYGNRPSSPGSGTSGDEYQALSPDSPIPEYTPSMPEHVNLNVGYRSPSPESIESDTEYALSAFLMSMNYGVEDRPDSPESVGSEVQERQLSVESIPEYKPLSPMALMLLGNIQSVSPESTQSLDEHKRLSPDSPLPWFTQNVLDTTTAGTNNGCSSPESVLSDMECGFASYDIEVTEMRPPSPQSKRSDDDCKPLLSESPIPDFTKTLVENLMTVRDVSPTEVSDSDDLSQTLDPFYTEERSASQDSIESDTEKLLLAFKSSITELNVPTANEATADSVTVAEYNLIYDVELWKLISQVHDPQYAGETFSSKRGFMQFIGSTIEYQRNVPDDKQDNKVKDKNEQDAIATVPSVSPPPMIEHISSSGAVPYRHTKYTFEIPAPEAQTESDDDWVVVSVSDAEDDDLRYSPVSLIDYRPMSSNSVMAIEARALSPESVTSVNEFRPLSTDSPLPEFTMTLPECVMFRRSASSSPETLASDIDYMPFGNLESQFAECMPSSPESALSEDQNERDRPLSSQSLPEYRPLSLELADRRASSPESMPELNENRSLSPDSPIPQFAVSLEEYTPTHRASSPESVGSDSECELMVTSSRVAETDRPSSPESISSVNEFRQLLPDSPVPEFMRILSSYFMDTNHVDRSSSPVSLSSDSEFVALPIDCWIDDSPRPLSPQTVESEEEFSFCFEGTDKSVSKPEFLIHVTSPLLPDQSSLLPHKRPLAVSPLLIQTSQTKFKERHVNPDWQKMTGPQSEVLSYGKWMQHGSEAESISTSQTPVCEEDFQKDSPVKPSPVQDAKRKEKKILHISAGELKSKTASQMEIAEELGLLSSDSSEEEVLTTRVVRRRVIIQADNLPDIPPQTVTEEKYTDEHGNMVVKKITRKVIRKYVSADGMETQEVTIEGSHQETVQVEEGDAVSRVVKRTVLHSEGDQKELTFSEPLALGTATSSEFEVEPVHGRKVSKVVKTTVVRGERMEKQTGDPSLAADLPSAREDFEKALSYAGGFGKVLLPHVVEKEIVQDNGSVVKRSQMRKSRTQKRTVVRDAQGKRVHLERLDDNPDAVQPDALQQHLHRLVQHYCEDNQEEEEEGDKK
ncbi:ankyrin-2b isoform X22 [Siniperca chuatsi]|uniref:ankyrin-2b isoform X22 n=1 Tax=Siniperca chuatsi TaxID=119488 RepID=UPI001CE1C6D4|nr:ankyrin-2b isoform X22 [Siniperca chuatsi]